MMFFLLHYAVLALHHLDHGTADAIGIDLLVKNSPRSHPTHFSGNFWWSTASHIRQLYFPIASDYLAPEMWICSRGGGRYLTLYQTPQYNFHRHINIRNMHIHATEYQNNHLEPKLLKPDPIDLFIEDVSNGSGHYFGHPPNWSPISLNIRPGIHVVSQELFSIPSDPYLGKIKFWIFTNANSQFCCYIEHQSIVFRMREPIQLEYEKIPQQFQYGTDGSDATFNKSELVFESNKVISVGNHMFGGKDPSYGKLKRWKLLYADSEVMTLPEHQAVVILGTRL
jgi:hypothetical protein